MPRPVIMDCDPGNDDAIALLLAMASPEDFNILGITTVGGNVPLTQINKNALQIVELANRPEIPVFSGCQRHIIRESLDRDHAHGSTGMDGASLSDPKIKVQSMHAVDFIIETLMNTTEKITLMPTGPLTNLAVAILMQPQIIEKIEEIVLMGGSITAGNITPAAEFNMYSDPHAAHIVFTSGVKITMIGLDVTHNIVVNSERCARFRELNNEVGNQIAGMMDASMAFDREKFGLSGRAIHDPCVPIFLIKPSLFKGRNAYVAVDIWHEPNWGATTVSFYPGHTHETNAYVPDAVNTEGVFEFIFERLARYPLQQSSKKFQ